MDELKEYEALLEELLKGVEVASEDEVNEVNEVYEADEY